MEEKGGGGGREKGGARGMNVRVAEKNKSRGKNEKKNCRKPENSGEERGWRVK